MTFRRLIQIVGTICRASFWCLFIMTAVLEPCFDLERIAVVAAVGLIGWWLTPPAIYSRLSSEGRALWDSIPLHTLLGETKESLSWRVAVLVSAAVAGLTTLVSAVWYAIRREDVDQIRYLAGLLGFCTTWVAGMKLREVVFPEHMGDEMFRQLSRYRPPQDSIAWAISDVHVWIMTWLVIIVVTFVGAPISKG